MITRRVGGFALISLLAATAAPLGAQELGLTANGNAPNRLAIQPESRLWFEGGSTVRGFECQATTLAGVSMVELKGPGLGIEALRGADVVIELDVPVADLDCGNGTMNDHMRKALGAEDHPIIRYRQGAHEVIPGAEGGAALRLAGWLEIAGVEREVALEGDAVVEPDGTLRVRGSHELDMTEFGVKPPRLMLGTLKVHDRVTVHYDMVLRP
jgi:hypothetical protein